MKAIVLLLLRMYQLGISPYLGRHCRFYPSCSDYARQAIDQHGLGTGSVMAATRLCKCHPWHPGGFDPVPDRTKNILRSPATAVLSDTHH